MSQKQLIRFAFALVALFVAYLLGYRGEATAPGPREVFEREVVERQVDEPSLSSRARAGGEAEIMRAFDERRSGVVVEAQGRVVKALRDDNDGSRHQRFILRLSTDRTVLVSHNIDLAPRVPLREGDEVSFRGQYEWNERGGVIHWTHRDPQRRRPGGWIRHAGQIYK